MNFYAQINNEGLVVSVSQLTSKVESEFLIPLENNEAVLLGMIYKRETGTFYDAPVEEIEEPVDEIEVIKQELLEQKALINAILGVTE